MSTNATESDADAACHRATSDSKAHAVNNLATTLFGKTRLQILTLLHGRPGERFYLRQLTNAAGVAVGAAQRELAELTAAGIVRREVEGRQVYFQANAACPVFAELTSILKKTGGRTDVPAGTVAAASGQSVAVMRSPKPATSRAAGPASPPPNPAFVWMTQK